MTTQQHTTAPSHRLRRGLGGLALSMCVLSVAACSSSTAGTGHAGASACASLPGCSPAGTPSSSVPAGLPADWSTQAIHAAIAAFQICAQAISLQPPNCPQAVGGGQALTVTWIVLNQPMAHAVAVSVPAQPATNPAVQVVVYGLYQMDVSYTTSGQTLRPYLDYDGGIAQATMTWDGHSFKSVQFVSHDTASSRAPSTLPSFTRPPAVTDTAALAAVRTGFTNCANLPAPLTAAGLFIPNCPQLFAVTQVGQVTSAHWSLPGDPMQGALVSFDAAHGNFAVTGAYHMDVHYTTSNGNSLSTDNGPHVGHASGNYTATLVWDGQHLTLLKIVSA